MSFKSIFHKLILWLIGFFFILLGILAILFAGSEQVRTDVIVFLQTHAWAGTLLGIGLILIGLGLFIFIHFSNGKKHYYLKLGNYETVVTDEVVEGYLKGYFETLFPSKEVSFRSVLGKKKIQIFVDLPPMDVEEQQKLTKRMGLELLELFRHRLGYTYPVEIFASFEETQQQ